MSDNARMHLERETFEKLKQRPLVCDAPPGLPKRDDASACGPLWIFISHVRTYTWVCCSGEPKAITTSGTVRFLPALIEFLHGRLHCGLHG